MGLLSDIAKTARELVSWEDTSQEDVPFDEMQKALAATGLAEPTEEKPRALFHDPYSTMDWGGWRQRPSNLTYESLRMMSVQNTVIAAIIQLRTNQMAAFSRPQQGVYDKGYRIIKRDRRDNAVRMTSSEQKQASELEAMLETTAFLQPDERPADRDSFRDFVKKSTRDALTYDQMCWEKIRDRTGRPSRFICLPAETIRPAVADTEHMSTDQLRSRVAYLQVYDNSVIAEFGMDDLAWCIMNPRSDLRANGFGFAPTEQIVRLVTAWLYGFDYNSRFFTQGSAIKGILNIKGSIPDRQLRAFRRMWYSMISGVQNAWKTPILNSEDIQWVNMHTNNRDMEYGQWMDWLTKLICSVYGIDPVEINFIFGNSGQTSSLSQSRPNEAEVTESKDKGLSPLADHITDNINRHLIWEMAPDLEFSFTGLDAKAESKERERRKTEGEQWKFIDEIRAEQDEEPLPNGQGQMIMNAAWVSYMQGGDDAGDGGDLGEGESDGSEDDGNPFGDDEDDPDDVGDGTDGDPNEGDDDFDDSQNEALAASASLSSLVGEELRKAKRHESVRNGRRRIDIKMRS
ncbi:MAG: phage portal protein [Gammaproteobacteria bacterium]|nr:phage portal protein [Gammaproteobacteria bacterium]